jgi:hypothetical protein
MAMAFCTQCGSQVTGAFCARCGTAAAGAATNAAGPAAPPEKRKTSPIVWVLVVLLCLFGLGIFAVMGTGAYVLHRARRAGIDRELFRSNPQLAISKMLAATHPDLEVIDTDRDSITVRNRRTGQRFTMSFDDARNGRFKLEGVDNNGHSGTVEVGVDAKIPAWVPEYPGSTAEPVFSARGQSDEGAGEAGHFRFETADSPAQVMSFYDEKGREMGLELHTVRAGETITLATPDDEHDRVLKVIARRDGDRTTVNVTYGRKR